MQYGRSGSVGGSIPPWSSVARYSVVFENVSSEFPPKGSHGSVELSFYVYVFLHVPHASITLLSALSAPLSLGRSLLHQLRFRFTFPFF